MEKEAQIIELIDEVRKLDPNYSGKRLSDHLTNL